MRNFYQKKNVIRFTEKPFTTLIICLAILITALAQYNPADAAIRPVAIEEETAPGFNTGSIFYDFAGDTISINNSGQTTFTATVMSGATSYETLWRENSGTAELISRTGNNAPGISGNVLFRLFENPNINDTGQVAFIGMLQEGSGVDSNSDKGIWKGTPGSLSLVAREGDSATGSSGDSFGGDFSAWHTNDVVINNSGWVAYYNNLNNATTGWSVWQENASGLKMLARTGKPVPGILNATYNIFYVPLSFNNNGVLAFCPQIFGNLDWTDNGWADLIQKTINSDITTKYKSETAAPGVTGAEFMGFSAPPNFDMNASGQLVFGASLRGADFGNEYGIWSDVSGSLSLVAQVGSHAPGTPTGAVFQQMTAPILINDSGQIVFQATLKQGTGGVDNTNNDGIWLLSNGSLTLIARTGDHAPGTPEGVVFNSSFSDYAINSAGQIYFLGALTGTNVAPYYFGIWLYDPSNGLSLVVREGDEVILTSGETVTFNSLSRNSGPFSGGSDGRNRRFNDNGEIVFGASVMPGYRDGFFIANTSGSAPITTLTADAGSNQSVAEGNTVTLDASGSTATGSTITTYSWTQTDSSGTTVTLSSSTKINPTFTAPQVDSSTTLIFSLTVTDNIGSTSTDSVSITITNTSGGDDGDNTDDNVKDDDDSSSGCFISNVQK